MEIYETEKEQVEALKRWWKENGRTVIAGLVLGLGGVLGYTSWQRYQAAHAETASLLYEQLLGSARAGEHDQVRELGQKLTGDFADTSYASLGALVMARSAFVKGEAQAAKANLRWVAAHAGLPELQATARYRLARLLLAEDDADGALELLGADHPPSFRAVFQETRGDILVAQGRGGAAREAYRAALAQLEPADPAHARIQLKLNDLGTYTTPENASR